MTNAASIALGPRLVFLCSEKPDEPGVLNAADQYMKAVSWWTAGQLNKEPPSAKDTTIFLESASVDGLVRPVDELGALYRSRIDEIGTLLKTSTFAGDVVLFIGTPAFLRECVLIMMGGMAPPQDPSYDNVRPMFEEDVRILAEHARTLLPGELFRFCLLWLGPGRFVRTHMMPILMQYLHHGEQLDGVEAAIQTLPPVQALSPTWPRVA